MSEWLSNNLISMMQSCVAWVFAFFVSFLCAKKFGVNKNIPKDIKKRVADLRNTNSSFISSFTACLKASDEIADNSSSGKTACIFEKDVNDYLARMSKIQKKALKVFSVYMYDNPTTGYGQSVCDNLELLNREFTKIARALSANDGAKIIEVLGKIKDIIDKADRSVDRVLSEEEDKHYQITNK